MNNLLKSKIKEILPDHLIKKISDFRRWLKFKNIKTNADLFNQIYKEQLWGKSKSGFCSGSGSNEMNSNKYVELINNFLNTNDIKTIVDVGCGDFQVAKGFNLKNRKYIGCDIVKDLIEYNTKNYSKNNQISFINLDIVNDVIPNGNLLLIRQVLQHLSNKDIEKILTKIKNYKHIIITDELPNNNSHRINYEIVKGGTRLENNSGLYLEKPPFKLKLKTLLTYPDIENQIIFRTILIENS
jgi:SAM-dependent methyltransferase